MRALKYLICLFLFLPAFNISAKRMDTLEQAAPGDTVVCYAPADFALPMPATSEQPQMGRGMLGMQHMDGQAEETPITILRAEDIGLFVHATTDEEITETVAVDDSTTEEVGTGEYFLKCYWCARVELFTDFARLTTENGEIIEYPIDAVKVFSVDRRTGQ